MSLTFLAKSSAYSWKMSFAGHVRLPAHRDRRRCAFGDHREAERGGARGGAGGGLQELAARLRCCGSRGGLAGALALRVMLPPRMRRAPCDRAVIGGTIALVGDSCAGSCVTVDSAREIRTAPRIIATRRRRHCASAYCAEGRSCAAGDARSGFSPRRPGAARAAPAPACRRRRTRARRPTGTPRASRLTASPRARQQLADVVRRRLAFVGELVARITSFTTPSVARLSSRSRRISFGPMPSSGDSRPISTK